MRVKEKNIEKRNLEAKNPTKTELKISESLTSMSSTMVDDCPASNLDEKSEKPPSEKSGPASRTSQFFRRFRLSAKTRSKYRNELRRSNSLLEMSSNGNFLDQNSNEKSIVSSLDWLRRRKRPDSEDRSQKEEMYVGNTLLKQKPRLRVRNAGEKREPENTTPENTRPEIRKASTLPVNSNLPDPAQISENSENSEFSDLTRVNSTEQRTDMEQVLYRAARLRRRRDRSKSNETRRSKSENHQRGEPDKNSSIVGSVLGSDHFGSSTTLHSTTAPLSEDSFLAASSARSYNLKCGTNPEQGSITTEYDPNSTGSQDCIGESSSGYWSRGEKEKDEISLKDGFKDLNDAKKMKMPIKAPINWNIPKQDYIVNRVEIVEQHKERKKSVTPTDSSLFYVALVGEKAEIGERKPENGYRVRSGYTGRSRNFGRNFTRTQSLTRDGYSEDDSVSASEANEIRRVSSEIRDTRRRSRASSNRTSNSVNPSCDSSQKFIIQPDDIKVKEDTEKEEWKITIKISKNSENSDSETITKSIPKVRPKNCEISTQTSPKATPVSTPVPEGLQRASRGPPAGLQTASEAPVVVKWEQPPKPPVIKTSADRHAVRAGLPGRFSKNTEISKITRKDVLPDLPVRERPRFQRRDLQQNKFKNILSQWEDRINLSRTQSLDVINCESAISKIREKMPEKSFVQNRPKSIIEKPVEKLPPLNTGPTTSRLDAANLTKYSSENSIAPNSFLNRRFSSTRNCSLPRTFGNIGGMGRHSYRPGCPIGWKAAK